MAELLKDIYTEESLREMAGIFQSIDPTFPVEHFLAKTIDETWLELGIKGRMRKITLSLGECLPADYHEALAILDQAAPLLSSGLFGLFVPDFVEVYGQAEADWAVSIQALEKYTQYWSSEMAVRPFIINHEERMMAQMNAWAKHENEHVRRLASEGCRPLLPWSQPLTKYKEDPTPVLQLLEQLKADPSAYVRKSVANNLNDISKHQPELIVQLAKDWYGENDRTNWIVKHGCRTLLKQGNREVLALFGYGDSSAIEVQDFKLETKEVVIGEAITFSFTVLAKKDSKVRLEYGIDYMKANGKSSRKIFQLSAISLKANEAKFYRRKHSLKNVSVRKHYPGTHSVTLIVNGTEQGTLNFEVGE
ncbi:DNA alkylation repair protein [Enterococcus sp. AZ109]|uniref:DNA alkylation repair protein n=1 Tax=Enterococcus sp. AZ109 TaxID=2774634 RepID=UPI003F25CD02